MIKVIKLKTYTPEIAAAARHLMTELSRSGKDKGEIPESWFTDVINSPWHDLLLAIETPETTESPSEVTSTSVKTPAPAETPAPDAISTSDAAPVPTETLILAPDATPVKTSAPTPAPLRLADGIVVLGMASLSIIMGVGVRRNAYLEDFVVTAASRGKGVSTLLWEEMLAWAREKGARRLEFTCGHGRDAAHSFYHKHGATIYDTDFFRYIIED